jgi:hypothetical protein
MTDEAPPKRTEKLQVMLDEVELEAIDAWRFRNRMPSRAAAIRKLISRGLEAGDLSEPVPSTSQDFRVVEPNGETE